jgi:hypothetical protein
MSRFRFRFRVKVTGYVGRGELPAPWPLGSFLYKNRDGARARKNEVPEIIKIILIG